MRVSFTSGKMNRMKHWIDVPDSVLHKPDQIIKEDKVFSTGTVYRLVLRWGDGCGNGHNSFAHTVEHHRKTKWGGLELDGWERLNEKNVKYFPKYRDLIPWHMVNSTGPWGYVANSLFHAKNMDFDLSRSSAIWPDATITQLFDPYALVDRLPELMEQFKATLERFGFEY